MSEICTVNDESLARAVEIIHDGGLVVIPTDTVYGVACDPRNIEAIRKVFAAKQRPKYKSLQVLLPSIESMEKLHLTLPVPLNRLAAMFMPGAFSPIAEAEDDCSLATLRHDPTTGKATQGVRTPQFRGRAAYSASHRAVGRHQRQPFRRGKRTNGAGSRGRAGRCGGSVFGRGSDSGTCIVHGGCSRPARARRHRDSSGGSDSRAGHP